MFTLQHQENIRSIYLKKKNQRKKHEPLEYANESNSMRKKGKRVHWILACSLLLNLQNIQRSNICVHSIFFDLSEFVFCKLKHCTENIFYEIFFYKYLKL